jgi:hypothetical protein
MKPRHYTLHGYIYRLYSTPCGRWLLDARPEHSQTAWAPICEGPAETVQAALVDAICAPVPLLPSQTYTVIITGRVTPTECIRHADTLRGHGFTYIEPQPKTPAHWLKPDCTMVQLTAARALAASLGLIYKRLPQENRP